MRREERRKGKVRREEERWEERREDVGRGRKEGRKNLQTRNG